MNLKMNLFLYLRPEGVENCETLNTCIKIKKESLNKG